MNSNLPSSNSNSFKHDKKSSYFLRLNEERMAFAMSCLIDKEVVISLENGEQIKGLFNSFDPASRGGNKAVDIALNSFLPSDCETENNSHKPMIVYGNEYHYFSSYGFSKSLFKSKDQKTTTLKKSSSGKFKTDTEISASKQTKVNSVLTEWKPSESVNESQFVELDKVEGEGWDQFETNNREYGVVSTFDENLYTTSLNLNEIPDSVKERAEMLAAEIENSTETNYSQVESLLEDEDVANSESTSTAKGSKDSKKKDKGSHSQKYKGKSPSQESTDKSLEVTQSKESEKTENDDQASPKHKLERNSLHQIGVNALNIELTSTKLDNYSLVSAEKKQKHSSDPEKNDSTSSPSKFDEKLNQPNVQVPTFKHFQKPLPEHPKLEQPKIEPPKAEQPKPDPSRLEQSKQDKKDQSKQEKQDQTRPSSPKQKSEQNKQEHSKSVSPKLQKQDSKDHHKQEHTKLTSPKQKSDHTKQDKHKVDDAKVQQKVDQSKSDKSKLEVSKQDKKELNKVEQTKQEPIKTDSKSEKFKTEQNKVDKKDQPKVEENKVEQVKVEQPKKSFKFNPNASSFTPTFTTEKPAQPVREQDRFSFPGSPKTFVPKKTEFKAFKMMTRFPRLDLRRLKTTGNDRFTERVYDDRWPSNSGMSYRDVLGDLTPLHAHPAMSMRAPHMLIQPGQMAHMMVPQAPYLTYPTYQLNTYPLGMLQYGPQVHPRFYNGVYSPVVPTQVMGRRNQMPASTSQLGPLNVNLQHYEQNTQQMTNSQYMKSRSNEVDEKTKGNTQNPKQNNKK